MRGGRALLVGKALAGAREGAGRGRQTGKERVGMLEWFARHVPTTHGRRTGLGQEAGGGAEVQRRCRGAAEDAASGLAVAPWSRGLRAVDLASWAWRAVASRPAAVVAMAWRRRASREPSPGGCAAGRARPRRLQRRRPSGAVALAALALAWAAGPWVGAVPLPIHRGMAGRCRPPSAPRLHQALAPGPRGQQGRTAHAPAAACLQSIQNSGTHVFTLQHTSPRARA